MTEIISFTDPRLGVRNRLRELAVGRPEREAQGLTADRISTKAVATGATLPWVQVADDGNFRDANLNGRATVRVVVWHSDEGLGLALARLLEALLLGRGSSDLLRGCNPLIGPRPTGDPDTGAPMSYFTITARLRPVQHQEGA